MPTKSQFIPKGVKPNTRAKFGSPESNKANISGLNDCSGLKPSLVIKQVKNNLRDLYSFVEEDIKSMSVSGSHHPSIDFTSKAKDSPLRFNTTANIFLNSQQVSLKVGGSEFRGTQQLDTSSLNMQALEVRKNPTEVIGSYEATQSLN